MRSRGIITILLFSLYCLITSQLISQDIIVKTNGDEIEAKVVKISPEMVEYYKFGKTDGPLYTCYISDIFMIKYPDGSKDVFEHNSGNAEINTKEKNEIINDMFIDERDSNEYKIVKIGEQWWMAENLKFITEKSRCYNNDDTKCEECGRLYFHWEAKEACPMGWRLPTDDEWGQVEMYVGMDYNEVMKSGWRGTPPGQAPELLVGGISGLDIKFCGYEFIDYKYYSVESYYWASTPKSKNYFWMRHFKRRASIERNSSPNNSRLSVRCVKDSE